VRAAQEIIADLASAGLSPEQLALVIELSAAVAVEARPTIDKAAENKRAYDREYQKVRRKSRTTSYETNGEPPEVSPKDINQTPSSPPVDASEAKASSHQPRPWALPAGVSLQVWDDFKKNRAKKRLPNTDTAWKAFLDDLSRVSSHTGIPPPKLIEQCTAKGWGAIYDPRDQRNERADTNPTATALRRVQDALRSGSPVN
jgi:hypothetical protein